MEGLSPVSEQPVELGTGWYLRGDAAWSLDQVPLISSDGTITTPSAVINGYSFDLGFGYKINNWLRADIVYDYRKPQSANASEATVFCPYNLIGLSTQTTPPIELGYYANPNDTCTPKQSTTVSRQDLLVNGYIDVGTWGGVTPYVGAGIGTVETQVHSSLNYYETANGTLYNANLTPTGTFPPLWININGTPLVPQPAIAFTQQNWNKILHSTSYHLAWALMGGFAIRVTDHLQADIGYRYVNLGTFTGLESTSSGAKVVNERQSTQEIRVGFRYMVD
jgi:opacity protein-like surface antigen